MCLCDIVCICHPSVPSTVRLYRQPSVCTVNRPSVPSTLRLYRQPSVCTYYQLDLVFVDPTVGGYCSGDAFQFTGHRHLIKLFMSWQVIHFIKQLFFKGQIIHVLASNTFYQTIIF